MTVDKFDAETRFAISVVRESSRLARHVQPGTVVGKLEKEDRSPVTVADFAVQALVSSRLVRAFPEDVLVAEEDTGLLSSPAGKSVLEKVVCCVRQWIPGSGPESVRRWIQNGRGEVGERFWTLDPIDGTKGFLRGDQYVVALALILSGQVRVGVLGCPALEKTGLPSHSGQGALYVAVRGNGCWVTGLEGRDHFEPVRVSSIADPASARVLRSVESGHTDPEAFDHLLERLGTGQPPVLMDSQAKCATLAAGHADLMFRLLSPERPDYHEKIWDQAAGSLVIEEAGGKVTDLRGLPLDFGAGLKLANNRGVLASNGSLHELALRAIEDLGLT